MGHPNEDVVRQGYKAFGEGDMDTLRSVFAPDVVHEATGDNPVSGRYEGIDDVLGYYGQLFERSDGTFSAELMTTTAQGDDTVVATHRNRAKRAGKELDQDETLTFTLAGGRITRLVERHSDPAGYDDFWS
jgi:ketosteroid isomerase-like protein